MTLFSLAVLPGIALLIYVYKKDTREKEPGKLLLSLFFLGVVSCIPAVILEEIFGAILTNSYPSYFVYILVDNFLIVGIAEELSKFVLLKLRTFKNPNFDYSFDGLVYAIFVSLGFATFENVLYVLENGFSTAIARMFSAVPGHMCFAVYMGYFYSRMRIAANYNNQKELKKNRRLALIVPALIHGMYDFLISCDTTFTTILWFAYVVALFFFSFKIINKCSKSDICIVFRPESIVNEEGTWKCPGCGMICRGHFCAECGSKNPNEP